MMYRNILHKLLLILFFMGLCQSLGCSWFPFFSTPKGPRYPEDHVRFERAVEAVERLRTAYVQKDLTTTKDLLLPLEDLDEFGQEIDKDFRTYSDISLELSIERINVKGDLLIVHVQWKGNWRKSPAGVGLDARGHGFLKWSGTQVILMAGFGGDLPFGMASRQAFS